VGDTNLPATPKASSRTPRVAVIGAGAGGVCMGVYLRRLGVADFTIFEQSDGLGGTWWDNVYPGAEVDTPQPFYSFSFMNYDFSRDHVQQGELQHYLQTTASCFGLDPHFRFNTAIDRLVWDESTHTWEVFTSDGKQSRFDVVVSAVGLLNHPNFPTWPGLELFEGPKFHSARWPSDVDLKGKVVAVVGTGSTSGQLVPAIAPDVAHLYVFQRQPGWVVAKGERVLSPEERARNLNPLHRKRLYWQQWWAYEKNAPWTLNALKNGRGEGSKTSQKAHDACVAYIESVFADRPDLAKMVTPDYPVGGKRIVKDSNFYPALLRDNVELIPHAVSEVTAHGLIDETGREREIDVLVMCTGFTPAQFLATYEVVGRAGRTIHEYWGDTPRAYLGLMVPEFPNFYMMYGPNTNGAPIMFLHQRQAEFVSANIKRMIKADVTAIEVKPWVYTRFNRWLEQRLSNSVVANHPEVHFYGRAPSGKNVIGWGEGMVTYSALTRGTPRLATRGRRLAG
jgi:cation diffusion facilitator CzcD-associated flavoprotein CzcO